MKKLLIAFFSLLCLNSFSQTTMSFTTYSGDLARPGAGAETWIYQNTVPGIPGPVDDYYRFHWATDFQPGNSTATQFNWTALDGAFQNSINNNRKVSFGIMHQCGACGTDSKPIVAGAGMVYPVFLHNLMQAQVHKDLISGGEWIANYNGAYLTAWKRLHDSIEYHINHTSYQGVPFSKVVRWIDVNGMGDYGEWTNNAADISSGDRATVATKDSIIAYVVRGHPNTHCQLLNATFDCNLLSNTQNDPQVGYFALTIQNNTGLQGYRRESWGNPASFYDTWTNGNGNTVNGLNFGIEISNRYKYAPITGELQDACQSNHMSYLGGQVTTYHMLSFGNGNLDNCETGNSTAYANIVAASKLAGYRLILDTASMTTAPPSGGAMYVRMAWRNTGTTPSYDHWIVKYRLKLGTSIKWTGVSSFDPYLLLPSGSDNVVTDNFTLTGVPAGAGYILTMSIEDVNGYQRNMPLFINTAQNSDGSYTIKTGITVSATGAAVANAGIDQTITLPTSSVTLDGTASSGTITSYTWTKISGPNTPTIASPSGSTTSVTGLVAGVYVFQLALNGGSTDQTQVTVNAAIPPASTIFTSQIPKVTTDNDVGGANPFTGQEVGLRFTSTIAGYITGIRFYKTAGNAGTHTGQLYSNSGTLLASATFTNETTTGWQVVSFPTPVAITANTSYVAAYFSSQGFYTEENDYFKTAGVTNTQLSAPADGTGGASGNDTGNGQGPYKYSNTPTFPNQLFRSANYWVDVVFSITPPGNVTNKFVSHYTFYTAP